MKKNLLTFMVGITLFALSACNLEDTSDMTVEEIYEEVTAALQEIESFEAFVYMEQISSSVNNDDVHTELESDSNIQMIMEPLAIYIDTTTNESYKEITGDIPATDTETYLVDNELYTYSTYSGNEKEWVKETDLTNDVANDIVRQQISLEDQSEVLQAYADYFTVEQSDGLYVLRVDMDEDDDELTNLVKQTFSDGVGIFDEVIADVFDSMHVHSLALEIAIDEETFFIQSNHVNIDLTMGEGEEESNNVNTLEVEYSEFNDVDSIEVPEEVKAGAVEAGIL